jgi:hypothetical protein
VFLLIFVLPSVAPFGVFLCISFAFRNSLTILILVLEKGLGYRSLWLRRLQPH